MSEVGFNILVVLADAPKHGYEMLLAIEQQTGSQPGPGTLYAAIAALEERRWIEPIATDDPRRPYQITPDGQRVMRVRLAALSAESAVATSRWADA
jgi:DNA-binding PadR family transcriptional regulator